jgi:hypothetical protein
MVSAGHEKFDGDQIAVAMRPTLASNAMRLSPNDKSGEGPDSNFLLTPDALIDPEPYGRRQRVTSTSIFHRPAARGIACPASVIARTEVA